MTAPCGYVDIRAGLMATLINAPFAATLLSLTAARFPLHELCFKQHEYAELLLTADESGPMRRQGSLAVGDIRRDIRAQLSGRVSFKSGHFEGVRFPGARVSCSHRRAPSAQT